MQNKKSSCSKVKEKALIIDSFGKPFTFLLPDGQKMYRSLLGAILTVVIFWVVSFYAIYKWQLLIDKDEARITLTVEEDYFTENDSVINRNDDGFNIAFGIFSLLDRSIVEEDESIGTLKIRQQTLSRSNEISLEEMSPY